MWQVEIGVLPVLFADQGDEFVHHLAAVFSPLGFASARGTDGTTPVEVGPPLNGPVRSRLLIRPHGDGISCAVVGEESSATPDQIDPWRLAVVGAQSRLGECDREFSWQAIIGTSSHQLGLDRLGELRAPTQIGPVTLTPGGVCMREYISSSTLIDRTGFGVRHSFPVIASGRVSSYAWRPVEDVLTVQVRRTCALLSLATGELWIPRMLPMRPSVEDEPLKVPALAGGGKAFEGDGAEAWTGQIPEGTTGFEVQGWAAGAWPLLDADPELHTATSAHYEAMRLRAHGHPSLAYLTFVAAIEGYGTRFVPDAACTCHPDCTHSQGVAQKRFRKALKTVMTQKEVRGISEFAYDLRSHTGHRGALFGSEPTFGYSLGQLFTPALNQGLDLVLLERLHQAGRRVLAAALGRAPDL